MTFMLLAGRGQLNCQQSVADQPNVFKITSRQDVHSNSINVKHLHSSQEEADTRIILYSLDAVQRGATLVFVLTIQWYHQLCKDTYFITRVGNKKHDLTGASSAGTGWNKDFTITRVACLLCSWPDRPFVWQGNVNLLISPKPASCGGGISIYWRYYIKGTNLVYRCHQQLNMDWRLREINRCQSQHGILHSAGNPSACHIVLVDLKIWIASVVM